MTKDERIKEVKDWMSSLGFVDNSDAEIPNFQCGLKQYLEPSALIRVIKKEYPNWNPIDDHSLISPEVATLFYLAALDMVLDRTGNKDASGLSQ